MKLKNSEKIMEKKKRRLRISIEQNELSKKGQTPIIKDRRQRLANEYRRIENAIPKLETDYARVSRLITKKYGADRKSKQHKTAIKGYKSVSAGFVVEPPGPYDMEPTTKIYWDTGASYQKKVNEFTLNFAKEVVSYLRENNIQCNRKDDIVFVGKQYK